LPDLAAKEQLEYSVAAMSPTWRQRQLAFVVFVITLSAFGAVALFSATPLPQFDSFIPMMMAIVFVTDLITAVLLFGQFSTTGSRALLILASGYLFSSLIAIPFTLTFPGAFTPTGLLGADAQSAAGLSISLRFGFAVATLGYALLTSGKHPKASIQSSPRPPIFWSVALVIIAVCALTAAVTAGHDFMPRILDGNNVLPIGHYANGMIALTYLLALLLLWSRGKSVLDLWLMVAVSALLAESTMVALLVTGRFSLGFYANRLFPLIISKVVLIMLLSETLILNERLISAFMLQRRERENRLMSVEAATAAIVHEIKQPLTSMSLRCSAALRWLKKTPPDCEEAIDCLTGMMEANDRANEVANSTRQLFKSADHQMTPIEINGLAREVLRMVENDLRGQGVTVSTEFQEDLPQIKGDRTLLQQVILNLVKNAIEAMDTVPTAIKALRLVTTQDRNLAVSLSVQDTGPGINPKNGIDVFDAFFTTKSTGMGLGLSISRKIIQDHRGDLRLTKTSSNGCTFEITLPSVATDDSGGLRPTTTAAGAAI
jgi:signal transduction histidine kinase